MTDNTKTASKTTTGKHGHDEQLADQAKAVSQSGFTVVKQSATTTGHQTSDNDLSNSVGKQSKNIQLPTATNSKRTSNAGGSTISTASQITNSFLKEQTQKDLHEGNSNEQSKTSGNSERVSSDQPAYQSSTEVLSARPIDDAKDSSSGKKYQRENYPRVMQRERRQNKYAPKQREDYPRETQVYPQGQDNAQTMQYQPLRRAQNTQRDYGHNQSYLEANANNRGGPQQRRKHHHDHPQAARLKQRGGFGHGAYGAMMGDSRSESNLSNVKIYNDGKQTRFQNHPVYAYNKATGAQVQIGPNTKVSYVARNANDSSAQQLAGKSDKNYKGEFQQLQNEYLDQKNKPVIQQNSDKKYGSQKLPGRNLGQEEAKIKQKQQMKNHCNQNSASQPFYPQHQPGMTQESVNCLRFNGAAMQGSTATASVLMNGYSNYPSQGANFNGSQAQKPFPQAQQMAGQGQQYPMVYPPNNFIPNTQLMHRTDLVTGGTPFYPQQAHQPPMYQQRPHHPQPYPLQQQWQGQSDPQARYMQQSEQSPAQGNPSHLQMQIISTPLRMKTSATTIPQPQPQITPPPRGSQEASLQLSTPKARPANKKAPQMSQSPPTQARKDTANRVESDGQNEILKHPQTKRQDLPEAKASSTTASAEESGPQEAKHEQTFKCLTECVEWHLIVQVGNSQLRIPAKRNAVKFSDNAQELPILTKDQDLIEKLVNLEENMCCSKRPITQLNRPVNAGNNPSSSNNMSNNGYRKKESVQQAQREYESKMNLNLVGDQSQDRQKEFALHLPINNSSHEANTRLVEIYMHHRTQQLMCLEFDLTHLKLDETESSISGDYSDNFSINPPDSAQPTPFMGIPKNQGAYSYGQPSHVLYINQQNDAARQLRVIDQEFVERTTYFKLNGECHGQRVFTQDLKYQIQGKKIIKSIQERLIRAKQYIHDQIVLAEPGIAQRVNSKSSSKSNSKSPIAVTRDLPKTHQRSQKSVLSSIRGRNKRQKGPYLRRPDTIHIPVVNVTKSFGFKMHMPNLASIDNMLTNFNQIVMQEGLIQSFFLSFDMPVHQLSTLTPAISNSLVVKIPREIAGAGTPQKQQDQHAAYLAYQHHQVTLNQQFGMQMNQVVQQNTTPQKAANFIPSSNITSGTPETAAINSSKPASQLWDLVGEFNKIQVTGATTDPAVASDEHKKPFPYRASVDSKPFVVTNGQPGQSQPFSQQIATSSNCSNPSSGAPFYQQPLYSQVSSLGYQQPYGSAHAGGMSNGAVSSQTSNLSFHQQANNFGGPFNMRDQTLSDGKQTGMSLNMPPLPMMMLPQGLTGSNGNLVPQQFHQALYSLREHFDPQLSQNMDYQNRQMLEGPVYCPPEDSNYFSNLDRLLEAVTPRVSPKQLEFTSVKDFFKAFRQSSVFGLRVELLNEQTLETELCTFIPTLSSLVLSYNKPVVTGDAGKVNRILDFNGIDDGQTNQQNIQQNAVQECETSQLDKPDFDTPSDPARSDRASTQEQRINKTQIKFIENHESEPHYARPAFFTKIKQIMREVPHLKKVFLKEGSFNFDNSWFSMLWTCQRVCTVPTGPSDDSDQLALTNQRSSGGGDDTQMGSSSVSNIQFLAIFRFRPDYIHEQSSSQKRTLPIQLIGLLPYKMERESFWVSPSHLQTDNNLQGEMYDQICEDNIILLEDLKQRAIEFLTPQAAGENIHDFTHLMNSTNSSIFDLF